MKRAAFICAALLGGCSRGEAPTPTGALAVGTAAAAEHAATVVVPRALGQVRIDGEIDEIAWAGAGRTGPFRDASGAEARPFSDARLTWDEHALYLALYAADDDIRARVGQHDGPVWLDDAFSLELVPGGEDAATFHVDVSAKGVTMDAKNGRASWESGIEVAVDRDGTPDDDRDEDEEWIVEAALPWASLGVTPAPFTKLRFTASRCDTPRHTRTRRCGTTGPMVIELGAR